jgi:hypothetical protein
MRANACNISGFRLALGMVGLWAEDLGAYTGIRKDFKQQRMGHSPVDNGHAVHPT